MIRPEPEEILVAEVIEDPLAEQRRKLEAAKKAAARARAEAAKKTKGLKPAGPPSPGVAPALSGDLAADLLRMLRQPGGIQQAILMREILDRPEHRW